jgi:hypothetical protein
MPNRKDCTPDAPIPVQMVKTRKYSGPPKGSDEAKERMARVRAAQWEKNGLVKSKPQPADDGPQTHARAFGA